MSTLNIKPEGRSWQCVLLISRDNLTFNIIREMSFKLQNSWDLYNVTDKRHKQFLFQVMFSRDSNEINGIFLVRTRDQDL